MGIRASASRAILQVRRQGAWRYDGIRQVAVMAQGPGDCGLKVRYRLGSGPYAAARRDDSPAQAIVKAQDDEQLGEQSGDGRVISGRRQQERRDGGQLVPAGIGHRQRRYSSAAAGSRPGAPRA